MGKLFKWLLGLVAASGLLLGGCASIGTLIPPKEIVVRYEGEVDLDMFKQLRKDVEAVKASRTNHFIVKLDSPGGDALLGFEMARELRELSDSGVTVETRADTLCASMCTFLLAAGTPGSRYIQKDTLFLVHPLQKSSLFGPQECFDHATGTKDVNDKIDTVLILKAHEAYEQYTGQSKAVVDEWLTCGNEHVGLGDMAVDMHIADQVD